MDSSSLKFAHGLLTKYGWKEGKGLGKNENGIAEPIRSSLKFNKTGVGYDHGEEFTFHWWDHVFNSAAKSIIVENSENGVAVRKVSDIEVSTMKAKEPKKYGSFVKTELLLTDGSVKTTLKSTYLEEQEDNVNLSSRLSAEEMLKVCGDRTAHKAARHGMKLNGKLRRLEEQEMQMLKSSKPKVCSDPVNIEAKEVHNSNYSKRFKSTELTNTGDVSPGLKRRKRKHKK